VGWFEIKGKSFREEKAAKFAEQKGCKKKNSRKRRFFAQENVSGLGQEMHG
jgi:hypothetical protein